MTAISAIQQSVVDTFNSIGTNNFIVQKWPAIQMGPHNRDRRNRKNLLIKEGMKLREITTIPAAIGITVGRGGRTIKFKNEKTNPNVSVIGANFDFFIARDLKIAEGRSMSKSDDDVARAVTVIGSDIAETLFKRISPIGQIIKIEDVNAEVVGVFEKRGSIFGYLKAISNAITPIAMPIPANDNKCFVLTLPININI